MEILNVIFIIYGKYVFAKIPVFKMFLYKVQTFPGKKNWFVFPLNMYLLAVYRLEHLEDSGPLGQMYAHSGWELNHHSITYGWGKWAINIIRKIPVGLLSPPGGRKN